jgi:cytochrome c biogenesis protein ResB
MSKMKNNKIVKFLGSVKLALVILWTIIIVSFIGAVVPEAMRGYVFGSLWFLGLLAVFSLNILICVAGRLSFSVKKSGSTLVHLSVLLILAGALASYLFGARGVIELEKGQSQDRFNQGCKVKPLGFRVALEDFSLSWYGATPDKYPVAAFVMDKGLKVNYKLDKRQPQKIGNTGYTITVLDYFSDLGLDETMKAYNKSGRPNNPAVLLQVDPPGGLSEKRWVFAKYPGMGHNHDQNIKFKFDYQPVVKEYRSLVRINDEKSGRDFTAEIKVNHPFSYKGYTLYQSGYDEDNLQYTVLEAVSDPGTGFVFSGFLLLNAGLLAVFYPKLKRKSAGRKVL